MDSSVIRHMTLLMVVNCVRKTKLEDLLSAGKISQSEIDALMQEVSDKLYTFLTYLLARSENEKTQFLSLMNQSYPGDWEQPELSEVFEEAMALIKTRQI